MRFAALSILMLMALWRPTQAQDPKSEAALLADLYKRVGSWAIWRARDGSHCFLDSQTRGPTIFIGYNRKRMLSVGLRHDAWRSLEIGKDYSMVLQIDDQQQAAVMKTWRRPSDNAIMLGRFFADEAEGQRFLHDFQRGSRLAVIYEGRMLATYVLQYSNMAGEELSRCQAATADNDPFKPRPAGGAASDKPGPALDALPQGATLPKLSPEQHVEALRLAANLLARLPGFRILNEEEQKTIAPKMVALGAAVVWRNEGAMGLLHLFPDMREAQISKLAGGLIGGLGELCDSEFSAAMAADVRSPSVRRIHTSCARGDSGAVMRMILMPFKGGVYYLSTAGTLKDNADVVRTEELLRNALFEVVQR